MTHVEIFVAAVNFQATKIEMVAGSDFLLEGAF